MKALRLTKRQLIWVCLVLAVVLLLLIGFLISQWNRQAVFGLLELLVTFAIGLLGNVLAAGLFILMFERNDLLEDIRKKIDNVDFTCQVLYQRGIWVVTKRVLLENSFYETHYSNAVTIDILGIANKGFMENLYPGYANHEFELNDSLFNKPLFKRLQATSGFFVTVLFLDPSSKYAKDRNREPDNGRTIQDLEKIVDALNNIRRAYENEKLENKDAWKVKGSLEFKMFRENPHTSIFRTRREDDPEKSIMVVGLLPKNMTGDQCPSVIIHRDPDHIDLFDSYSHHLQEIRRASQTFLCWDHRGIT